MARSFLIVFENSCNINEIFNFIHLLAIAVYELEGHLNVAYLS